MSPRRARAAAAVAVAAAVALGPAPAVAAADPPPVPDPLGLLTPPPDPRDPSPPGAPGDEAERRLRAAIVDIARQELGKRRARESGDDCTFYNAAVEPDGRRCGIQWCAQFLRWVWREAGAEVGGLTYRPASLRAYGREHGTWHPGRQLRGVRPGDAVLWRLDQPGRLGHANIVVAVRGGRVVTIGGNEKGKKVRRAAFRIGDARVSGYTSPITSAVPRT